jgi:hypothetical protein
MKSFITKIIIIKNNTLHTYDALPKDNRSTL